MSKEPLYLKPNVRCEPLVSGWYAWAHLLAPATGCMVVANWQTRIMKSFVSAPQLHVAALRNPAMRTGPFLDMDPSRVPAIQELLERTTREQEGQFRFAEAVKKLNEMLFTEGSGGSLEPLYEKTPAELRGYVELVYDLNHHAAARFLEPLLYRSAYYRRPAQGVMLSMAEGDERPFLFSTPRLAEDGKVFLEIPFDDTRLDSLFATEVTAEPAGVVVEALGLKSGSSLAPFLTVEKPPPASPPAPKQVRIRYFGHACVLIETEGVAILTDALISDLADAPVPRYSFADLPARIDYVTLTHAHPDHVAIETLLRLRGRIGCVVAPRSGGGALEDPSLKLLLRRLGFANVVELDELESLEFEGGSITAVPFLGEHADLNIRSKTAFLTRVGGKSILCVADSCNLENRLYELVHDVVGDIDALFLGMECEGAPMSWLYGAFLTRPLDRKMDQSRRLVGSDCRRGLDMIERLRAKQVYIYAMGLEPWMGFIAGIDGEADSVPLRESNRLVEACRAKGVAAERLFGQKEIVL